MNRMEKLKSQAQIINNWSENYDRPVVSICCITYNHEKYIKESLDSFLMQETDFPFEIVIHDDASTDKTADIIREYEKNYPNLFRPIYQTENQYSKIKAINPKFNFSRAKGKYIALCEGDDYWTDPLKLQKQVNFMDEHAECSACFHPVRTIYVNGDKDDSIKGPKINGNCIFPSEGIVKSIFIRVISMVFRSEIVHDLPEWFSSMPYGDLPLQLICATKGNIGYIGGPPMAVYRRGVPGAWSEKSYRSSNVERRAWYEKRHENFRVVYDTFNKYSKFKFNNEIKARKKRQLLGFLNSHLQNYGKAKQCRFMWKYLSDLKDFRNRRIILIWIKFLTNKPIYNLFKKALK